MTLASGSYDVLVRLLRRSSPLVAGGGSKLALGVRGRADAAEILTEWAQSSRDPARPLVWMHAPSVGEGLQARAVLEAMRTTRPELQSVFTFFSPSAKALARDMPADVSTYLPWDVRSELSDLVALLKPTLVAFTKTEVWPGLTAAAAGRGIPVVLHSATLAEGSGRLRPWARPFIGPAFRSLTKVLAIAEADGARFVQLGVPADRVVVTGDAGVDSARERAQAADPRASHLAWLHAFPGPALVAGSTWEGDERVLLPAVRELHSRSTELVTVLAPHEPTEGHLTRLEIAIEREGLVSERLGRLERDREAGRSLPTLAGMIILVDRVGVLAELYTVGSIGFVGGGFHSKGLHSVLEPAAAALPVVFGPRYRSSRAADELVRAGGATAVVDAGELVATVDGWLQDRERRSRAGSMALAYVERHVGAARRTAGRLVELLPRPEGHPDSWADEERGLSESTPGRGMP